jgi:hypothetical protein
METTSPITKNLETLIAQAASELNSALQAFIKNRNSENLNRMRELQAVVESAIALAEANGVEVK